MSNPTFLRLAGPVQSWAGPRVTGNVVNSELRPTRSGLLGLLAGALGAPREQWPEWLEGADFTVRVDRPGRLINEFQTINPRATKSGLRNDEREFRTRQLWIRKQSDSDKNLAFTPDQQNSNAIIRRTYLAGAEFLVRVTCPGHQEEVDAALRSPAFVTYLGKKAFAPSFPFYLGRGEADTFNRIPVFDPAFKKPKKQVWTYSRAPYTADSGPGALPGTSSMVDVVSDRGEWMNRVAALLDR
ncbi:type I-E CRISPR-associated protein Cas5/CasD [Actinotignum sanguinis]|uniref:type I-E CRISPR-associated protein Cas5/CasD n=1 Tax=Actinotignum sanguinis TaxID=1445614 RepID=UPI00254BA3FA|nr:type I-E CRISPR-associated protein Cas5/CasD [Actinotignum sanguinis]MDK7198401.1 type I-E CRISPR-associated protein Cas5/CasD [Actinotignum sanguinis]